MVPDIFFSYDIGLVCLTLLNIVFPFRLPGSSITACIVNFYSPVETTAKTQVVLANIIIMRCKFFFKPYQSQKTISYNNQNSWLPDFDSRLTSNLYLINLIYYSSITSSSANDPHGGSKQRLADFYLRLQGNRLLNYLIGLPRNSHGDH